MKPFHSVEVRHDKLQVQSLALLMSLRLIRCLVGMVNRVSFFLISFVAAIPRPVVGKVCNFTLPIVIPLPAKESKMSLFPSCINLTASSDSLAEQ